MSRSNPGYAVICVVGEGLASQHRPCIEDLFDNRRCECRTGFSRSIGGESDVCHQGRIRVESDLETPPGILYGGRRMKILFGVMPSCSLRPAADRRFRRRNFRSRNVELDGNDVQLSSLSAGLQESWRKIPVMLYLHGSNRRGSDNQDAVGRSFGCDQRNSRRSHS